MTCSPGSASKEIHEKLISMAMQRLEPPYQRLNDQALLEKTKLYESIQEMTAVPVGYSHQEIIDALVPKFKEWIQLQGITVDEEHWTDCFFGKVLTSDTIHCVLVYYHFA